MTRMDQLCTCKLVHNVIVNSVQLSSDFINLTENWSNLNKATHYLVESMTAYRLESKHQDDLMILL